MALRSLKFAILAAPFLLAACGEGYDQISTDKMFPYGNQRTAGSGVAYVVAKMMPERELKLEPVKSVPKAEPAPVVEPENMSVHEDKMEQLFDEALKK